MAMLCICTHDLREASVLGPWWPLQQTDHQMKSAVTNKWHVSLANHRVQELGRPVDTQQLRESEGRVNHSLYRQQTEQGSRSLEKRDLLKRSLPQRKRCLENLRYDTHATRVRFVEFHGFISRIPYQLSAVFVGGSLASRGVDRGETHRSIS